MARRSLRALLHKKRTEKEKKALSSEMRDLMGSFEAQYGQREPRDKNPSRITAENTPKTSQRDN